MLCYFYRRYDVSRVCIELIDFFDVPKCQMFTINACGQEYDKKTLVGFLFLSQDSNSV